MIPSLTAADSINAFPLQLDAMVDFFNDFNYQTFCLYRYRVLCAQLLQAERKEIKPPRQATEMILDYVKLEHTQYRFGETKVEKLPIFTAPNISSSTILCALGLHHTELL